MNLKEKICQKLIKNATVNNENGYVQSYKDNIFEYIDEKYFVNDLMKGSGNELNSKFRALWSSSALAVNNFAPFIKKINHLEFDGNLFLNGKFERKFPTGLGGTPPNIDFSLENNKLVVAFESKFLGTLSGIKSEFKSSYFRIKYLDKNLIKLMEKYNGRYSFLHFAQLLKHSIGLINYSMKTGKNVILYYVYWTPINWHEFAEYISHDNELEIFTQEFELINGIKFKSIKYMDFWNIYEKNEIIKKHIFKIKERYELIV
jgi:hypothetical protein